MVVRDSDGPQLRLPLGRTATPPRKSVLAPARVRVELVREAEPMKPIPFREVADLFGIRMLDHVVIGRDRYVSFVDDGYW